PWPRVWDPRPWGRRERSQLRDRCLVQTPSRASGGVERHAAPAVDREFDVSARNPLAALRFDRTKQLDVRTLRRDERQIGVIQHRVDPDRTDHVRCAAGIVDTHGAPRAEDAALDRAKRGYLLEPFPGTVRFLGHWQCVEVVGKTEGKATDQATVGSKELD